MEIQDVSIMDYLKSCSKILKYFIFTQSIHGLSYAIGLGLVCLGSLPPRVKYGFRMASATMSYDQICIVGEGGNQRNIHNWDVLLCGLYG